MKKVFETSQVAHLWANKLQSEARNAHSNFYFDGDTIYSYGNHFPIAKHVENSRGEKAVLFARRGYSMTTNKHKSIVRHAASHLKFIYCNNPTDNKNYNFEYWKRQIEGIAANLEKAKKPEKYLSGISNVANEVKEYADFFGYDIPGDLQLLMDIENKEGFAEYTEKKTAFEAEQKAKAEAEMKKRHAKELKDWLSGKTNRLYTRDGYDYLRINGGKIETSQGIDMDTEYALFVYRKLKADRLKIGDKVLQYEVIKMNGVVTIGCHNFKKSYLLSFGKKLEEQTVTQA